MLPEPSAAARDLFTCEVYARASAREHIRT